MQMQELIAESERLVKAARDSYMDGYLEAAKHDLLVVASKILSTLATPADEKTPSPASGQL